MLINEAGKATNLTKKAIEYYTEHQLVFPSILENGYRDFSADDIERLKKISIFRKLGLSTEEVKAVLADESVDMIQKLSVQKELGIQREQAKKVILEKLCCGKEYSEIIVDLKAIEESATVTEKILDAFPGYYGRFICLHFARFLNEPVVTDEQRSAYLKIVKFLDSVPSLYFPEDLQAFLLESTKGITINSIKEILENTRQSMENPEKFLSENQHYLDKYIEYKQSEEYKNSPLYKVQVLMKEFNKTSGYYDVFIPAMKKLSASYAEYYRKMETANEKLLARYPEIEKLHE
ncbi:MAG: MerR family transcriptional regulator [Clostridiaceae bacterium]